MEPRALVVIVLAGFVVCDKSERLRTDAKNTKADAKSPSANENPLGITGPQKTIEEDFPADVLAKYLMQNSTERSEGSIDGPTKAVHLLGGSAVQEHGYRNWTKFPHLPPGERAVRSSGYAQHCGVTIIPPGRTRIVNGNTARGGSFPWIVALVHKDFQHYCAGTILDANWILTAAHCIIGPIDFRDLQRDTTVIVGVWDLTTASSYNKYQIADLVVHPKYNPKGWTSDIAMLRLSRPIPYFDPTTRPACLPNRSLRETVRKTGSSECFFAGWGYTKEGPGMNIFRNPIGPHPAVTPRPHAPFIGAGMDSLLEGRMSYLPQDTCQRSFQTLAEAANLSVPHLDDSMVCASHGTTIQGMCMGDSGGGLYCREDDNYNSWTVYGVASWNSQCARSGTPSVYASVFSAKKLIQRVLSVRIRGQTTTTSTP